jgi:hypothetical protein
MDKKLLISSGIISKFFNGLNLLYNFANKLFLNLQYLFYNMIFTDYNNFNVIIDLLKNLKINDIKDHKISFYFKLVIERINQYINYIIDYKTNNNKLIDCLYKLIFIFNFSLSFHYFPLIEILPNKNILEQNDTFLKRKDLRDKNKELENKMKNLQEDTDLLNQNSTIIQEISTLINENSKKIEDYSKNIQNFNNENIFYFVYDRVSLLDVNKPFILNLHKFISKYDNNNFTNFFNTENVVNSECINEINLIINGYSEYIKLCLSYLNKKFNKVTLIVDNVTQGLNNQNTLNFSIEHDNYEKNINHYFINDNIGMLNNVLVQNNLIIDNDKKFICIFNNKENITCKFFTNEQFSIIYFENYFKLFNNDIDIEINVETYFNYLYFYFNNMFKNEFSDFSESKMNIFFLLPYIPYIIYNGLSDRDLIKFLNEKLNYNKTRLLDSGILINDFITSYCPIQLKTVYPNEELQYSYFDLAFYLIDVYINFYHDYNNNINFFIENAKLSNNNKQLMFFYLLNMFIYIFDCKNFNILKNKLKNLTTNLFVLYFIYFLHLFFIFHDDKITIVESIYINVFSKNINDEMIDPNKERDKFSNLYNWFDYLVSVDSSKIEKLNIQNFNIENLKIDGKYKYVHLFISVFKNVINANKIYNIDKNLEDNLKNIKFDFTNYNILYTLNNV